jgi:hypothetical protein
MVSENFSRPDPTGVSFVFIIARARDQLVGRAAATLFSLLTSSSVLNIEIAEKKSKIEEKF